MNEAQEKRKCNKKKNNGQNYSPDWIKLPLKFNEQLSNIFLSVDTREKVEEEILDNKQKH